MHNDLPAETGRILSAVAQIKSRGKQVPTLLSNQVPSLSPTGLSHASQCLCASVKALRGQELGPDNVVSWPLA